MNKPIRLASVTNTVVFMVLAVVVLTVMLGSPLRPGSQSIPPPDSANHLAAGNAKLHGLALYKEAADHKGPLLFYIQLAGLALAGTSGVWLLELLALFIGAVFSYLAARTFTTTWFALLAACAALFTLWHFSDRGNVVGQYGYPLLACGLWAFIVLLSEREKEQPLSCFIVGLCCAGALMLRATMIPIFIVFPMLMLLSAKRAHNLKRFTKQALIGLSGLTCGIALLLLPLFFQNSLGDFWDIYIQFNAQYSSAGSSSFLGTLAYFLDQVEVRFVAAVAIAFVVIRQHEHNRDILHALSFSTILSVVVIVMPMNRYNSYIQLIAPLVAPILAVVFSWIDRAVHSTQIVSQTQQRTASLTTALVLFLVVFGNAAVSVPKNILWTATDRSMHNVWEVNRDVSARLNERDKVLTLGDGTYLNFLLNPEQFASRFYYQCEFIRVNRTYRNELQHLFIYRPPKVVVLQPYTRGLFDIPQTDPIEVARRDAYIPIMDLVEERYTLVRTINDYEIYERKDNDQLGGGDEH